MTALVMRPLMPWVNDRASRRRSQAVYGREYKLAREQARTRASGRCERCEHRHGRLECDHIINVESGGTHALANLQMLCAGPGTCKCHEKKTAREGGGRRASGSVADPEPRTVTAW